MPASRMRAWASPVKGLPDIFSAIAAA